MKIVDKGRALTLRDLFTDRAAAVKIFRARAGMISAGPCWVIFVGCYMYIGDTLLGALWQCVTEYQDDKHLVG